jgi:hypothetical protein
MIALQGDTPEAVAKPAVNLPEDFTLLHTVKKKDGPPLTDAVSYAERRGVSRELMKKWRVGLSVIGKYSYRIIFPVLWRKKLRGFVARDWTGAQEPKYLNSVGDKYLWNMPKATKHVHLCEGIIKAVALMNATKMSGVVSTLGSDITPIQIRQLKKAGVQYAVIWPDPDKPGQLGAVKIAGKLTESGIGARLVYPVPNKQLDDHTPEELRAFCGQIREYTWSLEQHLKMAGMR